ncbi:MAG: hypothetical protein KGJ89_02115 [Patescibacteria group bacterium]|nr:hypothetical protein [Patescibacteria group bacterium]MDE2015672.1 hypothetical protein [Patescibacteria group bacterium]MDE2226729.1 hypothetical protein [Patescibacteria group bacterium]
METIVKIVIAIGASFLLWKPFKWLIGAAFENAKSRIASLVGGIVVVIIVAIFIALIGWLLKY